MCARFPLSMAPTSLHVNVVRIGPSKSQIKSSLFRKTSTGLDEWLAVLGNEVSYVLLHLHQRANKNLMHYRRKLPPCKLTLGPETFQHAELFQ